MIKTLNHPYMSCLSLYDQACNPFNSQKFIFQQNPKNRNDTLTNFKPFGKSKFQQSQLCSSRKVSEKSKRTLQNDHIGPLHDCPQAPGHGTTFPLSCPRCLTLEVQRLALALWLWAPSALPQELTFWKRAPSALPQAQRPDNVRFRVFRPLVFAIFA